MKTQQAIKSVNKITSNLVKSTLEQGNSLIRSSIQYSQKDKQTPQIQTLYSNCKKNMGVINDESQTFDAFQLYSKIKPYTLKDQMKKKNIINILTFAQKVWKEFISLGSHKSGQQYLKCLQKFKVPNYLTKLIEIKLSKELNQLIVQQGLQNITNVKIHIKRIIEYLNQKSRNFVDKKAQISNIVKKKEKIELDSETHEQAIKEEMLQLLDRLKGYSVNISDGLKRDNIVISQIDQKQDKQIKRLVNKSASLQEIINSQKIGFFKLISMAVIGIAVWIFTVLFILIF